MSAQLQWEALLVVSDQAFAFGQGGAFEQALKFALGHSGFDGTEFVQILPVTPVFLEGAILKRVPPSFFNY